MNDGIGIKITPKMIQDMIGIPMGSIAVMELMYVHATISERVVVEDQTPLMKSWDTMKLKLRENEELDMGGFGRLRVKETYLYVEKHRLTKGKIREMKNSPIKDQGDILRHMYTPKVNLEDGVFEDVEGSKKMDAIKQFQKRTDEGICGVYVESVRTLIMNGRLVDDCTRLW
ncbi:hypothetical protein Tco_1345117 [Tanacetum coccineum]